MPLYNPQKGASDRYRGSDHTTVVNPEAGDYTLESGKLTWFYDGTSWARRTPVHWGLLFPADSFAEAFNTVKLSAASMLPEIPGDLVAYTADRQQAGSLTYTGRYNGTVWENISGADSSESIYWLDQAVNTVNSRVTTEVETLNDSIGNLVIPPDYYAGSDKANPINPLVAGSYAVEDSGANCTPWFYTGTDWKTMATGSGGLQHFQESTQSYLGATYNILEAKSLSTDVGIVFNPKGSGSLLAQTPDGTVANGNARGLYSWDFQTYRTSADQVASGVGSLILWASSSKAGNYSMVFSGDNCFANNVQAIILGGSYVTNTGIRSVVCTGGGGSLATGITVSGNNCFVGNGKVISVSGNSNSVINGEKVTITSSAGVTIAGNGENNNSSAASISGSNCSFGFSTADAGGSWYLTNSLGSVYLSNSGGILNSQRATILGGSSCSIDSGIFPAILSSMVCSATGANLSSLLSSRSSSVVTDYSTVQGANGVTSRTHHSQVSGYSDASRHTVDLYYTGAVTAGQTVTLRAQDYTNNSTLDAKKLISIGSNQVIVGYINIIAKQSGSVVFRASQSGTFFVSKSGTDTPVVTLYGWWAEFGSIPAYSFTLINSPTVPDAIELRVTCTDAQTVIAKATVEYEILS